jgi:purine-binding chemotaxis protein CheW
MDQGLMTRAECVLERPADLGGDGPAGPEVGFASDDLAVGGRAWTLARPGQYLAFALGEETYAMAIDSVREVIPFGGLTEVPLAPPGIRGILNLRGAMVPVVDLQVRFRRPATRVAPRTCVVIVELFQEGERHALGFLVDQVNEVLTLHPEAIAPPPAFGAAMPPRFLAGVAKVQGRFVLLLDTDRTLAVAELDQSR